VAGGAFALAALAPPVDAAAESSLVAHMVQHLVLVTVAAPLLGFGLPLPCGRRAWAAWAVAAVAASSAVLWAWHAPGLFDAAVSHAPVHGAEHLTMLGTAVVLWSVVAGPGRRHRSGVGVLAVLAASVPATALGAALTLAGHPWYSAYPSLDDQRVAGALMWAAGSVPGLAGGALLFAWWLSAPPPRASEA
jgi:cytochrome c oxidase assembly factor CtaG